MENLGLIKSKKPSKEFWTGKKVLITGHSGFKGGWLALWLSKMGSEVFGISLAPLTTPNLFDLSKINKICTSHFCDIRDISSLSKLINNINPEIIFHLAAQPLVRESYESPLETFSSNVMGTANVLESLRAVENARIAVMITTDKVYHNNGWVWPYRENDRLGGRDPYSASKSASELVIDSYRESFFSSAGLRISSARAGNVIGGGDWSKDRLIPDAVRAWQNYGNLEIRNPGAVRPWQHVLEPLAGYMLLAEKMSESEQYCGSYNFGPLDGGASVQHVMKLAQTYYKKGTMTLCDESKKGVHEERYLTLDVSKATASLGFSPCLALHEAIEWTMEWYKENMKGAEAKMLCERNIAQYESRANE